MNSTYNEMGKIKIKLMNNLILEKIMNIDMSKGVIFYMSANAPGMQELGSIVLNPSTLLLDGRTGQAISIQDIKAGMNMQATGIQQNGMIRATKITVIP